VAQAVRAMRVAGHDVVYLGERRPDPGDPHPTLPRVRGRVGWGLKLLPKGGSFSPRTMISESWFIVIYNRIAAYCFSTIWVMLRPKPG
jgi:hypothetical protein